MQPMFAYNAICILYMLTVLGIKLEVLGGGIEYQFRFVFVYTRS